MLTDGDAEEAGFALDARLFLNCHVTNSASSANGDEGNDGDGAEEDGEWPMECGGYTSYIAKNEGRYFKFSGTVDIDMIHKEKVEVIY